VPWRRFILAVAVGSVLASVFIFLLGVRVFSTTRRIAEGLLPQGTPNMLFRFVVDVPALVICTVPGVVIAVWLARRCPLDADCRCRKCGYILRGISEPRCPECGEAI
jgi:hypothetical protein